MTDGILLLPILIPLVAGVLVLIMPKPLAALRAPIALLATAVNLAIALALFSSGGDGLGFVVPWAGAGMDFALKLTMLNAFVLAAAAGFGFLVVMFSWRFMENRPFAGQFYCYLLITLCLAAGAVLADHLVVLLFFWEGLLLTLFGMIAIGKPGAWKTAIKALVIVGVSDLCLMVGIALAGWQAGTLTISAIHLDVAGLSALAMVLMIVGAIAKGGSMPFHSWIPDAATDAPMPFMALVPAAMEKLLGIYLLSRICLDMFKLTQESWVSTLLMVVGAATILLAVAMALVQKEYKRLLSYHAISQVGYMILGIGTATVFGIVGGLYHMINNGLYKSLLFMTGGAVEKQAGTSDLGKLGGLAKKMPVTFACFLVAALSISGFPLTNGFFSKELIYEGALDRNMVFYLAAVLGSFLTAASFLKLGHAAYLGKRNPEHDSVREAPMTMLAPMVVLAAACLAFAYNPLPIDKLLAPAVESTQFSYTAEGESMTRHEVHLTGMPSNPLLVIGTIIVLAAAVLNHLIGVKRTGKGLGAVDHIHYAPVLHTIYDKAEQRWFDPYDLFMSGVNVLSHVAWVLDRFIDWIYDGLAVGLTRGFSAVVRLANNGNYSAHIVWALVGAAAVVYFMVAG